jgi:hypothetical protein
MISKKVFYLTLTDGHNPVVRMFNENTVVVVVVVVLNARGEQSPGIRSFPSDLPWGMRAY